MLLIIALFTVSLVLLHWVLKCHYRYWEKRGVPGPKPALIFGNLGQALTQKKNLGQIYEKIYNDYKSYSYVGYYKFLKPGLIIRDIDLVKSVLIKDFNSFHDNDFYMDPKVDILFSRNPFALTGQQWKTVRNMVTSGITTSKVKNMFYLINNSCDNLVKYIEKKQPLFKNGMESKDIAANYTTDVVASCAFGLEAGCLQDKNSEFRDMGKKFISPSFWMGLKHTLLFALPSVAKLLKVKFLPTEVEDWFINIVSDTVKYRKENKINRNDYLDMLTGLQEKSGGVITDLDLAAQSLTFYADGFETSSILLAHALFELGENKDIQQKLRKEINTVLAKYKGEISYDAIQEMNYLDMFVYEALRKHPPALFMSRVVTEPFELPPPGGEGTGPKLTVEPGTPVIIPILAIHQNPDYYPNPQKFDPERFNEQNKALRPKCSFLGFGEGPRICLGAKFALAQSKAALVTIVANFEISVSPKTQKPLKLDPSYFLTNAVGGIWLNFNKINT